MKSKGTANINERKWYIEIEELSNRRKLKLTINKEKIERNKKKGGEKTYLLR